jgi:hypothetical protein
MQIRQRLEARGYFNFLTRFFLRNSPDSPRAFRMVHLTLHTLCDTMECHLVERQLLRGADS